MSRLVRLMFFLLFLVVKVLFSRHFSVRRFSTSEASPGRLFLATKKLYGCFPFSGSSDEGDATRRAGSVVRYRFSREHRGTWENLTGNARLTKKKIRFRFGFRRDGFMDY